MFKLCVQRLGGGLLTQDAISSTGGGILLEPVDGEVSVWPTARHALAPYREPEPQTSLQWILFATEDAATLWADSEAARPLLSTSLVSGYNVVHGRVGDVVLVIHRWKPLVSAESLADEAVPLAEVGVVRCPSCPPGKEGMCMLTHARRLPFWVYPQGHAAWIYPAKAGAQLFQPPLDVEVRKFRDMAALEAWKASDEGETVLEGTLYSVRIPRT